MVLMRACCCVPPSGISPESRCARPGCAGLHGLARLRRVAALCALSLLGACSREARAVRVPSDPGTELYRISCRSEIAPCREKASALCGGEYEVLQNAGAPVEPPRVSSAPGPRSTGSRYQRPDWVGELVVACGSHQRTEGAAEPALSAATTAPPLPIERAAAPDQLCVPGVTQLCLGPAACRGGQACLADGRGWGACDCGKGAQNDAGTGAP
jgi:hypothetical protein